MQQYYPFKTPLTLHLLCYHFIFLFILAEFFKIWLFSFFLIADGRLNAGHAGVLLAERRGSYPPIDLQILKSTIPN